MKPLHSSAHCGVNTRHSERVYLKAVRKKGEPPLKLRGPPFQYPQIDCLEKQTAVSTIPHVFFLLWCWCLVPGAWCWWWILPSLARPFPHTRFLSHATVFAHPRNNLIHRQLQIPNTQLSLSTSIHRLRPIHSSTTLPPGHRRFSFHSLRRLLLFPCSPVFLVVPKLSPWPRMQTPPHRESIRSLETCHPQMLLQMLLHPHIQREMNRPM